MEGIFLFIVIAVVGSLLKNAGAKQAQAQQNRSRQGSGSTAFEQAKRAAAQVEQQARSAAASRPTGTQNRPAGTQSRPAAGQGTSYANRGTSQRPAPQRPAQRPAQPRSTASGASYGGKMSYQNQVRGSAVNGTGTYRKKFRTGREKWEESSVYEHSNSMDVRYTSRGCGCYGEGDSTSAGRKHGYSSASYDEQRFFNESRAICSGNWS